jgi:hypothetical protein
MNEIILAIGRTHERFPNPTRKKIRSVLAAISKDLNCTMDDITEAMEQQERIKGSALRLFEKYGNDPNDTLEDVVSRAPADDPDAAFLNTPIENDLN